tara:strand:- start:1677 stop:1961 length:285 start_codon:yes stop_codon:yes gene_type:complete
LDEYLLSQEKFSWRLALPRLETRIRFANDVHTALAANNLTVRVPIFERFDGRYYFHTQSGKREEKIGVRKPCQRVNWQSRMNAAIDLEPIQSIE